MNISRILNIWLIFLLIVLIVSFSAKTADAHSMYTKQHVDYHMKKYQRLISQQAQTNRILRASNNPSSVLGRAVVKWTRLAHCESTNRWHINGHHSGGLQFLESTWDEMGGEVFADNAHLATPIQQAAIAEKLLSRYGKSQWDCRF